MFDRKVALTRIFGGANRGNLGLRKHMRRTKEFYP
jgi:hypothetical protein